MKLKSAIVAAMLTAFAGLTMAQAAPAVTGTPATSAEHGKKSAHKKSSHKKTTHKKSSHQSSGKKSHKTKHKKAA